MYINIIFDRSTNVEHTTSISNSTFILWRSYCFLIYLFFLPYENFSINSYCADLSKFIIFLWMDRCECIAMNWRSSQLKIHACKAHILVSQVCKKYKNGFDD